MPSIIDTATTRDGIRLLTRHWPAGVLATGSPQPRTWPVEAPRAAVLIVHGLEEHSGRYEEVGAQLAAAGLEVFAWDHRGFGESGGERAWVEAWSRFHDDVEDRLAAARAAVPGRPAVLYGHSLGGLIALSYALSGRPLPDLMVLSAPGIDDNLARWKHRLAGVLSRVAPHLRIDNGINGSMLSRGVDRHDARQSDPLIERKSTARFGALAFAAQSQVRADSSALKVPTLVIHGLDDPIVPALATEPLAAVRGVTRRTYPGLRHELHNEPEGPAIIGDVIAWINRQLDAARSAAAPGPGSVGH